MGDETFASLISRRNSARTENRASKIIDIDLFTATDFNAQEIADYLTAQYNVSRIQIISNGVFCLIDQDGPVGP